MPRGRPKKTVDFVAANGSNRDGSLPDLQPKRRKPQRKETYGRFIYKLLQQVHPELGFSSRAMSILNSFVDDIFQRIAQEAAFLVDISKKKVMSAREIESAVKLNIPGELKKHAVSEGTKALTKYANYKI